MGAMTGEQRARLQISRSRFLLRIFHPTDEQLLHNSGHGWEAKDTYAWSGTKAQALALIKQKGLPRGCRLRYINRAKAAAGAAD